MSLLKKFSVVMMSGMICVQLPAQEKTPVNPFFSASTLPFQAVPFDRINNEDFKPAIEKGIAEQGEEIQKIADNPAAPTFENTLVPIEKSGQLLNRVSFVLSLLSGANTNPVLQKLNRDEAPVLAAHYDGINLNVKLFKRIESIYNQRQTLKLNAESLRLVEYMYQNFIMSGARLSDADKIKLKKLNAEEAILMVNFTNKLLAAAKNAALVVDSASQLAGISQGNLDAFAQEAKAKNQNGKWVIPIQNTTQQPMLSSLSDRATRQALFNASWTRAERSDSNDTRSTLTRLAQLRAEKANLLGFPNYASWALQNQMAKNPAAVEAFLSKLIPSATAKAKDEAAVIQTQINQQNGGFELQPWDWDYYAGQVRKEKYNLDENEVKPYFELNHVLENGVFYAAGQLYGLQFKERHDLPVYQNDVRVFEVFDADNKSLALWYCDYFKRDNKSGGAWNTTTMPQSFLLNVKPVIYNVCNFTKPATGQPALISSEDVRTMFHEFGHALHGFFASQQYPDLSGSNVARDFVEFPSQFNENWAWYPSVFKHYAIHYKTGDLMPDSLVIKIKNAQVFNQGYVLTEALAASSLDMQWHTLTIQDPLQNTDQFENEALHKTHLDLPQVPSRYRSSYFLHIWSNGYASGYYAYSWTKMLAQDAFSWFEENGGLTRANGQRFRDMILSRGSTVEYGKMFRDFRGHDPAIGPMLKTFGLPIQ